jgi:hypothetical protein
MAGVCIHTHSLCYILMPPSRLETLPPTPSLPSSLLARPSQTS